MSINNSPALNESVGLSKFRFWCQKVLPLVYDDSLSYYEALCKIANKLNEAITSANTSQDNIVLLKQAYDELIEYINNYTKTLDAKIVEEINVKLNNMAESGELYNYVVSRITPEDVHARPDTWLPTIAEIGAAPAGFGLGENLPVDIGNLDLANRIGWFRSNQEVVSLGLTPGWWFGNYIPYGDNEGVWELNHYLDGLKANIRKVNGVLQPVEWVNPPMIVNDEYRTTERYAGKPVYVRAVDCGNIPNATYKIITYGEEGCEAILVYGATNYVGTVPSMNVGGAMGLGFNSDQVISLWGSHNTIGIACGGDRSSASLVCVVKYYKTTD